MASTFQFYMDSALTDPYNAGTDYVGPFVGTSFPQDAVIYYGSTDATRKVQADSDPGVDNIVVSLTDAATSSGVETTDFKLATSSGGLASATAGASLDLGVTEITGGVANAVAIHVRCSYSGGIIDDTDCAIEIVDLVESVI